MHASRFSLALAAALLAAVSAPVRADNLAIAPVPAATVTIPTYELALAWNDTVKGPIAIPFTNPSADNWTILGTNATGNIYVAHAPAALAAGATDTLTVNYNSVGTSDVDTETIRISTDHGVKLINVHIARAAAVTYSASYQTWAVGEALTAKSVDVSVAAGTVQVTGAHVLGAPGASATVQKLSDTLYRVSLLPGSTAQASQAVAVLDFDQPLPGKVPVLLINVQ